MNKIGQSECFEPTKPYKGVSLVFSSVLTRVLPRILSFVKDFGSFFFEKGIRYLDLQCVIHIKFPSQ